MKFIDCFCFSFCLFALVEFVQATCVLESDFGFKINCAFKKSGLFRVRNLGGLKAHASLGFSLGDELGFEQSISNMDPSRRRSVSVQNGSPFNFISDPTVGSAAKQEKRGKQNRVMMRPMTPPPASKQAAMDKLTSLHRYASSTMRPIIVSATTLAASNSWTGINPSMSLPINPTMTMAKPLAMGVPAFKPLPPKEDTLKVIPITALTRNSYPKQQISQAKGPALFFNPVPVYHQANNLGAYYPAYNTKKVDDYNSITGYGDESPIRFNKEDINAKIAEIVKEGNISMEAVEAAIVLRQQQLLNKYANMPLPTTSPTITQRTTTTEEPFIFHQEPEPEIIKTIMTHKPKRNPAAGKVMNAPREYYPVGYEKNFDDQFQSKVDLPETNFHCGEQKYFPGLYGDEGLGCMVFHVCALTDDGLVMKSFLCPESTLFDQTILKCNWWFYVDCKNTRRLYDTNMPVSKSYELMKALTFFSSYKKEIQEDTKPEDVEGIKEAIMILENQDSPKLTQASTDHNAFHVITPRPIIDERNNHNVDVITGNSSVYIANKSYSSTNNNNTRRISAKRKSPESRMRNSDYKLVTVNADLNFNNRNESAEIRNGGASSTSITSETNTSNQNVTSSDSAETKSGGTSSASTESKSSTSSENTERKHTRRMTLHNNNTSTTNHPPVKRFYRSSAEIKEDTNINNEKVQTTRPTSVAKLVGEFPTPTATIAKLDEAILGTRVKREEISKIPQQRHQLI